MANNIAVGPNAVVAHTAGSFVSAGITSVNTEIIYKVGNPNKSYVPGRGINGVTAFEVNAGYYFVSKQVQDLTGFVVPPITSVAQLSAPASFAATPISSSQIGLSWASVSSATSYVVDRATNSGFTTGVTLAVYNSTATSFNNTGLTPSTQYYYRVRAVAVGFTDSNYSTANATTSAIGATLELQTFPTTSITFTESPAGTFQAAGNARGLGGKHLASSSNGYIQMTIADSDSEGIAIGLDDNNTLNSWDSGGANSQWKYMIFTTGGTFWYVPNGSTPVDTATSYSAGDLYRLNRVGTTVTAEKSSNGGSSWTTLHTFSNTSSALLYQKAEISAAGDKMVDPKIYNGV